MSERLARSAHFAVSACSAIAKASGVLPTGSSPSLSRRSRKPGARIALATAAWSAATFGDGVYEGASSPYQELAS